MERPQGFNNTGAICWINSLLQSLLSSRIFVRAILHSNPTRDNPLQNALINMITASVTVDEFPSKSALVLLALAKVSGKEFSGQQSASEGLTLLLDKLNIPEINSLFTHKYLEEVIVNETGRVVSKNFGFNNQFMFFDEETLLTQELENFIRRHDTPLTDYKTDENFYTYSRVYRLRYIPKIIVILLNRYRTDGKNSRPRNPNIKLKNEFKINSGTIMPVIKYKKIAEIDHFGDISEGHYLCRVRRGDDGIFTINDNMVSPATFETNPNTYMTFYEEEQ